MSLQYVLLTEYTFCNDRDPLIMDYCERNDIPVELDPADRRKGAAK